MIKKKPKNALFVITDLQVGGAQKLLVELVNRFDLSRVKPTIVSLDSHVPLAPTIAAERAGLHIFPRRWRYDLSPVARIQALLGTQKFDVVVAFALFDYFFARLATWRMKNPPDIYIYIHSTVPPNRKRFVEYWLYSRLLGKKERIIAVCNTQADYWAKTYGISHQRFITIYGAIDTDHFSAAAPDLPAKDIRQVYGIPQAAKVVTLVAGMRAHKRQNDAIRALKIAQAALSDKIYLLLVGTGKPELEANLKTLAAELALSDQVIFCGVQSDVRPFYLAADLFTLTSDSVETFPLSALEAMAMGLPCVLTEVGGVKEMVQEGVNGYLVPPRNPQAIAAGWLQALEENTIWDKKQIRDIVVNHFAISNMVIAFSNTINNSRL